MKKFMALFLAALMLLALCACGNTPTAQAPSSTPEASPAPSPTPYAPPETFSVMAGSIQAESDGTIWTSLAPMEGTVYLYDLLPDDIGYVYSFLIAGDCLYAAIKEYNRSMDPACLYVFDKDTGEGSLLADNLSPACSFCLVGEEIFLYRGTSGFWSLNASTGETQEILPDDADLIAARDGLFYYTLADGGLYRNNSTFSAEEKLLDTCPSYWLCPGTDTLFHLSYGQDGASPALEHRSFDGTLLSSIDLAEDPGSIHTDGERLYVPQPGQETLLVYDMATGEALAPLSLPQATASCLILHAAQESLYCQIMTDGLFQIVRLETDGSGYETLAEDLLL